MTCLRLMMINGGPLPLGSPGWTPAAFDPWASAAPHPWCQLPPPAAGQQPQRPGAIGEPEPGSWPSCGDHRIGGVAGLRDVLVVAGDGPGQSPQGAAAAAMPAERGHRVAWERRCRCSSLRSSPAHARTVPDDLPHGGELGWGRSRTRALPTGSGLDVRLGHSQ